MKKRRKARRIEFQFYSRFTGDIMGSVELFYNPNKAIIGHYSRFIRKFKLGLANLYKQNVKLVGFKVAMK